MSKSAIEILFPNIRVAVLGRLLFDPSRSWYLSELAKSIGLSAPDIRRELSQLSQAEIIKEWRDGNRVYFSANTDCPFFTELRGLILKTSGLVEVVRDSLSSLSDAIVIAFVYGSIAKGKEVSESDVDLMIVGDVSSKKLSLVLKEAEEMLQREINTSVYSKKEFLNKINSKDHFVSSILRQEKIFVLGSDNELAELIKK